MKTKTGFFIMSGEKLTLFLLKISIFQLSIGQKGK